jgi:hypothetical protein
MHQWQQQRSHPTHHHRSYPLIASEILSSDMPQILDSLLIDHVDLLKDLWEFLDKPTMTAGNGMPSDLASNFAKVNCSLLAKRSEPVRNSFTFYEYVDLPCVLLTTFGDRC